MCIRDSLELAHRESARLAKVSADVSQRPLDVVPVAAKVYKLAGHAPEERNLLGAQAVVVVLFLGPVGSPGEETGLEFCKPRRAMASSA
eukprot:6109527-Alexandrium_andersonii.AAC.1